MQTQMRVTHSTGVIAVRMNYVLYGPVSSEDLTESWEPICMIGLVVSTACPVQDSSVLLLHACPWEIKW